MSFSCFCITVISSAANIIMLSVMYISHAIELKLCLRIHVMIHHSLCFLLFLLPCQVELKNISFS